MQGKEFSFLSICEMEAFWLLEREIRNGIFPHRMGQDGLCPELRRKRNSAWKNTGKA